LHAILNDVIGSLEKHGREKHSTREKGDTGLTTTLTKELIAHLGVVGCNFLDEVMTLFEAAQQFVLKDRSSSG
jgi:hypothetical protein